ncbi:MAG: hypothetical protein K2X66_00450 [Cyanobacteria bacterium]|nr:hypothetical protein [Cyanobacteriota bacterium]
MNVSKSLRAIGPQHWLSSGGIRTSASLCFKGFSPEKGPVFQMASGNYKPIVDRIDHNIEEGAAHLNAKNFDAHSASSRWVKFFTEKLWEHIQDLNKKLSEKMMSQAEYIKRTQSIYELLRDTKHYDADGFMDLLMPALTLAEVNKHKL